MKIVNTTLKVLLYTTKNKNKINLTNHFSNVMTYSILLGGKSWFHIFKMIFCSIKINITQFSTDLFVWLVNRKTSIANELSKCEIGFRQCRVVSSKMVSRNYLFKKNESVVCTYTWHALFFFNEDDEIGIK